MTQLKPGSTNGDRASLLSETARVHIEAVTSLETEVASLRDELAKRIATVALLEEALTLTRRQLTFYQNFALGLCGKLDAVQAIITDAIETAQSRSPIPDSLRNLAPDEESRLDELESRLTNIIKETHNG